MPVLKLTNEQVIELIKQLPSEQQEMLLDFLLLKFWPEWAELSSYGIERARETAAKYGRNWENMTEEEREEFIDDLIHEGRQCKSYT
ncbi:MAG: hypothetical protein ABRQ37_26665 [Candidatus Eremiobacterota bacterium]